MAKRAAKNSAPLSRGPVKPAATTTSGANPSSRELLLDYQAGVNEAADLIFHRYLERLLALARSRMSTKLHRRLDPDDVVQSAYRSFFVHAKNEEYVLQRAGDLWRLLASITLHKLYKQAERHTAASISPLAIGGTAGYMAPEVARGITGPTPEADIFALGVLLWVLVTDQNPTHSLDFEVAADCSERAPLATIVRKCIHDDPAFRFVTAAALETTLRAAVMDDATTSPREG